MISQIMLQYFCMGDHEFLLGAATSSHQVEGNNTNNDWWAAEQKGLLPRSGEASGHNSRFEEDNSLAHSIGLNAMRLSLEWSRLEPLPGQYDAVSWDHYRQELSDLKQKGFSIFLTLHHFTLPVWAAERGGFFSSFVRSRFLEFAEKSITEFDDLVDCWVTINEPQIYGVMSYFNGAWPPFHRSLFEFLRLNLILIKLHKQTYSSIKKLSPQARVGIAKNNAVYIGRTSSLQDTLMVKFFDYLRNFYFLNSISKYQDFIGLNYYFTFKVGFPNKGLDITTTESPKTDLNWPINPEGLYQILKSLKKFNVPIYITENGLADKNDILREGYIESHIRSALKAKNAGVDVRGYFYWSLMDNFEWADGFEPRFGLIEINYSNLERRVRDSAKVFKRLKQELNL